MGFEVRIPRISYQGGGKIERLQYGELMSMESLVLLMVVFAIWVKKCPHRNSMNHGQDFSKVGLGSML